MASGGRTGLWSPVCSYRRMIYWRYTVAKTNLVIVESPAKAKTIGKYLGPGYEVKASMGHVRDLPKSKLGVDVEHGFLPDYQPIKGKEEVNPSSGRRPRGARKCSSPPTPTGRGRRSPGT